MYKKGYELGRRIAFSTDNRYNDVRLGTYFIDFEIGKNYTLVNTASVSEKSRYTPLFSGTNKSGSEFSIQRTLNASVGFYISTIGTLVINGRFGSDESHFQYSKTGFWDTNFDENNNTKRRIRLALSVDIDESQRNKNPVGIGLSDSPIVLVDNALSNSPNINASGTFHIGPLKLSMNVITGSGTGNSFYTIQDSSLDDSPDSSTFEIKRFYGQTSDSPAGGTVFPTNPSKGRSTKNINLYPSSIGYGINANHMGSDLDDNLKVNSGGEIYFYGFAFLCRNLFLSEK